MEQKKDSGRGTLRPEIESLARVLLPEIQKYFVSEDGRRDFEKWKQEQASLKGTE